MEGELPLGPNPDPVLESIEAAVKAGIDHVYLHQIGDPCDPGFIRFWEEEIKPGISD